MKKLIDKEYLLQELRLYKENAQNLKEDYAVSEFENLIFEIENGDYDA